MFEPEKQQVEICLLKSNLKKIEHDLDVQRMTVPVVNAEFEKKYRNKSSVLKVKRDVSKELERLHLENMQRVATGAKVKRLRDDIVEANETASESRNEFARTLDQKEDEINTIIHKFGDSLWEKAEIFRKTHRYYNEEDVNKETEGVNNVLAELKDRENKIQRNYERLRAHCEAKRPDVHENFTEQVDKVVVNEKTKSLEKMLENLKEELQALQKHF